ncbi:unnamed protein product [Cyprideis torosa]|uniref:Uncharacterized protein n=1 Tax=Cyprideis torosa TaxID=163714 RepID=A0A7R8W5F1_9CRUS|nr:unnamed protein product [Cyprideis torosa]CAG0885117.1 unnamed protein product [Cyprideis torosa]
MNSVIKSDENSKWLNFLTDCLPARYVVAILAFLGFVLNYALSDVERSGKLSGAARSGDFGGAVVGGPVDGAVVRGIVKRSGGRRPCGAERWSEALWSGAVVGGLVERSGGAERWSEALWSGAVVGGPVERSGGRRPCGAERWSEALWSGAVVGGLVERSGSRRHLERTTERSDDVHTAPHHWCLIQSSSGQNKKLVNINIAIVAMVNHTAIPKVDGNDTSDECGNEIIEDSDDEDGEFVWDESRQALILGSFFWGYITTQLPGGRLGELIGVKRLFGLSLLGASLLTLLTPVAAEWDYKALIVLRVLIGVCEGVTFPSMHAMIARWAPPHERSSFATFIYAVLPSYMKNMLHYDIKKVSATAKFYIMGGFGMVFVILWFTLVYDSPEQHPWIKSSESSFILNAIREENSEVENGLRSAAPYLSMWMFSLIIGRLCDFARQRKLSTPTRIRNVANSIAHYGPALCLIGVIYSGCNANVTYMFLVFAVTLQGALYAGFLSNHVDMAPNFAGTLFGITNMLAALPSWIAPLTTGYIVEGQSSESSNTPIEHDIRDLMDVGVRTGIKNFEDVIVIAAPFANSSLIVVINKDASNGIDVLASLYCEKGSPPQCTLLEPCYYCQPLMPVSWNTVSWEPGTENGKEKLRRSLDLRPDADPITRLLLGKWMAGDDFKNFQGNNVSIAVLEFPPFITFNETADGRIVNIDGLDFKILDAIGEILNFSYYPVLPENRTWADEVYTYDTQDGHLGKKMIGVTGLIADREADFAPNMAMTETRKKYVQYSDSYYWERRVVVTHRPKLLPEFLAMIRPFTPTLWVWVSMYAFTCGIMGLLIYYFSTERIFRKESASRYDIPLPQLLMSAPFEHTGFMFRGKSTSMRLYLTFWWLIGLVIANSYLSMLTAQMSLPSYEPRIESLHMLQDKGKHLRWISTDNTSALAELLYTSEDALFSDIRARLEMVASEEDALDEVAKGKAAFIFYESAVLSMMGYPKYLDQT